MSITLTEPENMPHRTLEEDENSFEMTPVHFEDGISRKRSVTELGDIHAGYTDNG